MPLISTASLKSFFGKNSFATSVTPPEGHDSAIAQATNIVYQHSLIAVPVDITNAIPSLQFYAHCIYAMIISNQQNLDEKELKLRKNMFDAAMSDLKEIRAGKLDIFDANGVRVTSVIAQGTTYYANSDDRSEKI